MSALVDVIIPPLANALSYRLPEALDEVGVGFRVQVPLGKRRALGFVVQRRESEPSSALPERQALLFDLPPDEHAIDSSGLKAVTALSEHFPLFLPPQLQLFEWVANYYGDSLANVIDVAIPSSVPSKIDFLVRVNPDSSAKPKGKQQQLLLAELRATATETPLLSQLRKKYPSASALLKKLAQSGAISLHPCEQEYSFGAKPDGADWAKRQVSLNQHQSEAVAAISAYMQRREFGSFLLHGITGSGKTEVYIEAIQNALRAGLGALVLVPEIALTPQLVERFAARLGGDVAVLHSALPKRLRWNAWRALLDGKARVAIGARSAVFAPIKNLGLIVVDEEHDASFKQSEGLRYNGRDVAVVRAQLEGCPVVLGSATPSLESFYRGGTKRYQLLTLPLRHATHARPSIEIVDLNKLRAREMPSRHVSPRLLSALQEVATRNEQAFVLYNQRGFARYMQCDKCKEVIQCANCSVTLTYHQHSNMLVCHYCGLHKVPPSACPSCMANDPKAEAGKLVERGGGTERVVDELKELFPNVAIDRLDRDAASNIADYEAILSRVRSGETRFLVGTQMIAKGHDLPDVTLVGVVDCDIGLHMPDFRANERVFQLLTQAAGRCGRGEKAGLVLLQTRLPTHPALIHTQNHDFHNFAMQELAKRKELRYPPFSRLLRIVASADERELPAAALQSLRDRCVALLNDHQFQAAILGPAPAPLVRLKGVWRAHMMIKSRSASQLNVIMRTLKNESWDKAVKVTFDLDPQEML